MWWSELRVFQAIPDGKTLSVALSSIQHMPGKEFRLIIVDRGYRGHEKVGGSEVILPDSCAGKRVYTIGEHKLGCRRRSELEAVNSLPEMGS
ncbi:MAG: hypothetical protein AAF392_02045 [Bacteroidota bacterium]